MFDPPFGRGRAVQPGSFLGKGDIEAARGPCAYRSERRRIMAGEEGYLLEFEGTE